MKRLMGLSILLLGMLSFSEAAAEDAKVSGEVSVTGLATSISGSKAKANEYRDIRNDASGDIRLKYDSEKYEADFHARDMGYDSQRYSVEGRKWGDFKYDVYFNEIPHNFTYDAKSLYSGTGTSRLVYPAHPPSTNPSSWSTFDYSTKRKNLGGGFKLDAIRPFFFDVSASREEKAGIYALSAAGTSPGGIAIELPAPISYRTDNVKLAAGYARDPAYLSLGYFYSSFTNDNPTLSFRNPSTANTASTTDSTTMAPKNHYYKIDLAGGFRLPANSKFDVKLATASARSEGSLLSSYVADVAGGLRGINLSNRTFNGQIDTHNLAMSLTSKPLQFLDTRFFLKYDERWNKSDQITTTDGGTTILNDLFDYRKNKFGAELGFRLPAKFYLNTRYTRGTVERKRDDIPKNIDDLYGAELRWKGLDFMAARVGYERFERKAEFRAPPGGTGDFEYFIRRFDAAERSTDAYKATLEFFPVEDLNFSIGYRHRETNYRDTILGLTGDRRNELSIDADYLIGKRVKLFGFFDYERIHLAQFQRQASATADPALSPTATNFNWTASQEDETYNYTLGTDIFLIPEKLTLRLQGSYVEANGSVDYTYLLGANPLPAGRTQDNIDISDWDAYRLSYYLARITYNASKAWSAAVGYAYERYRYSDAQYDGYAYVPATTGTNGAYLTGAYADPSYESHTVFATLFYRF
ncbi:MAG: MtrB/PioB family outer membrane beta-barrel protein [Syntrophales bacterium]|jgi:MtrB/PioB family decaheme-associated outer membrane protein|nr:MtrB/PioB family outer membrane beta-barrel protein [Syntrophales bacterium]